MRARSVRRLSTMALAGAGLAAAGYVGIVTGACPVDVGVGRRTRPLGPQSVDVRAPRGVVFDVIAEPYLGRPTRALEDKIKVLHRGSDLVLAAHYTPVRGGLVAQTVETVRFARPHRVDFRLVRGPVPHVVEEFVLTETSTGTRVDYRGEMAADLWAVGWRWSEVVARSWEAVVAKSFASIRIEAERRARVRSSRG
ncbi:MAG: SRPBCC family protein [Carbonactinosporaceae bacterium]